MSRDSCISMNSTTGDHHFAGARLAAPGPKPFLFATGDRGRAAGCEASGAACGKILLRIAKLFACWSASSTRRKPLRRRRGSIGIPSSAIPCRREPGDIEAAIEIVGAPCYVKPAMGHEWRRVRRGKLEAQDIESFGAILEDFMSLHSPRSRSKSFPGRQRHAFGSRPTSTGGVRPVGWRTKRKIRQYPLGVGRRQPQDIADEPLVPSSGSDCSRSPAIAGRHGRIPARPRDGRFVLMEINVRTVLGPGIDHAIRTGCAPARLPRCSRTGLPGPRDGQSESAGCFLGPDLRAFRELRERGSITHDGWLGSVLGSRSFAYFAWDDPGAIPRTAWRMARSPTQGQAFGALPQANL